LIREQPNPALNLDIDCARDVNHAGRFADPVNIYAAHCFNPVYRSSIQ
jgi:hypothetical protein